MPTEYKTLLLYLLHSLKKPCKPKKLDEQKILEFLFGISYKLFTLLEMIRRCSALYTMRCRVLQRGRVPESFRQSLILRSVSSRNDWNF